MALSAYTLYRRLQSSDGGLLALTSPTTIIGANNGGTATTVAIGFTWAFNDTNYTTLACISAQGFIRLDATGNLGSDNTQINGTNTYIILAPWWDQLITRTTPNGGGVFTELQGVAPNRVRVIEWVNDASFNNVWTAFSERVRFQVALYETSNKIEYRYGDASAVPGIPYGAPLGASASCGVKVSTSGGQAGNIRDFFGTSGTPAGSTGPFLTNRTVFRAGGAAIMWPGDASNSTGLGKYNFHFQIDSVKSPKRRRKPMKSQFLSTEALRLVFGAFRNETTGALITGTDTCTVTYRKPDNSTATAAASYDSTLKLWTLSIATGSYAQGQWLFTAESNDATAHPQSFALQWGDYVETVATNASTAATQSTAGAASAVTAAAQATIAATQSTAGAASAVTAATQATTAATQATQANTWAQAVFGLLTKDMEIANDELILYDTDGTTPLVRWDVFDITGAPTSDPAAVVRKVKTFPA